MVDQRFFNNKGPFSLTQLAEWTGIELDQSVSSDVTVNDVAPLDRAGAEEVSFFDNSKYLEQFKQSSAGVCFVKPKFVKDAPDGMVTLVTPDPYRAYALIAQRFYPFTPIEEEISPNAFIHETASIGSGCCIATGAYIGKNVQIGDNCMIGPNAVLYDGVIIGKDVRIGAVSTLSHCVVGDHVIIHRGVHIGQDGFGFAMGREGHVKVPQLGRVSIGDHVEIGAGTCIDRGTGPDTTIGEGTKIDNLVQIGHNVQIGRMCVIVSQTGISGSTKLGDGVVVGGQAGLAGHLKIGSGAKLAARTGVTADLEAGKSYGGSPAVPIKDWHRQVIALNRLIKK
ncbi:MAG: UDP-3-O-(3-hydroxymyristoyl)glucosamine N-acyltransferase [Rickettsiales bacterium]|nr:UDP-3-O-(3-hydroxymyristoyl)glucosamine N-acyltransferase [Rickettsiales bacterium]